MSDEVPYEFRPRLCHLVKWPDFQGYGFNLHAEKGKAGQFIGKVDSGSPAEAAGLREADRIVEVDGVNIGNENHQQVVTRVKAGGEETRLLVVDSESDNWYKDNKKVIKGDLPEVIFRSAQRDNDVDSVPHPAPPPDDYHSSVVVTQTPDEEEVVNSVPHNEPPPEDFHQDVEISSPPDNNNKEVEEEAAAVVVTTVTEDEAAPASAPAAAFNGIDEDAFHRPRLCVLKIWPHFQGYGFNLHAERDKPGQYIGLVDEGSPALAAGLRVNDRIIEVNGVNIESESHTEVIARIKANPGTAKMLVIDQTGDAYYKQKGQTISSSLPQVDVITAPDAQEDTSNGTSSYAPPEPEFQVASSKPTPAPEPTPAPAPAPVAARPTSGAEDGLELNLSVAEMKERLKAKKRQDPRGEKISFEQKYKAFERM